MKLTDPLIKSIKPADKPKKFTDGGGLNLLVTPSGSKLWRYRYRLNGKESMLSLGDYPTVTLKAARLARDEVKSLLAQGIDPAQSKREAKLTQSLAIENSFEAVALEWFNHWKVGMKSERYIKDTWQRLSRDVLPVIGKKPLESITTPILVMMIKAIAKRGVTDLPKRAHFTTGQIFRHAMQNGFCTNNPTTGILLKEITPAHKTKNQTRIPLKELPKLLRDIDVYDGNKLTQIAVKLIALTFVRTKELIEAEWSEFDLTAARWTIPAERMKKDTPHIVPLARQTMALLFELRNVTGGGAAILPSQNRNGKYMSNNTILGALYRMGYHSRMTGHGFRGVASTVLNEQGYSERLIETQLAHLTGNEVSRAYNHAQHLPERAAMMQWYADFLDKERAKGEVIKMVQGL